VAPAGNRIENMNEVAFAASCTVSDPLAKTRPVALNPLTVPPTGYVGLSPLEHDESNPIRPTRASCVTTRPEATVSRRNFIQVSLFRYALPEYALRRHGRAAHLV
jgi:hypothetical protein